MRSVSKIEMTNELMTLWMNCFWVYIHYLHNIDAVGFDAVVENVDAVPVVVVVVDPPHLPLHPPHPHPHTPFPYNPHPHPHHTQHAHPKAPPSYNDSPASLQKQPSAASLPQSQIRDSRNPSPILYHYRLLLRRCLVFVWMKRLFPVLV
jgi:hypothetical protein